MIPIARLCPFPPRGRRYRRYLKPGGELVEYNSWWQRREAQGDCKQGQPPKTPKKLTRAKTEHEVG